MIEDDTMKKVEQYIKNKEHVSIYYNNETGDWVWAIDVDSDSGFWLNAFSTRKKAVKFCEDNQLPITLISGPEDKNNP